MRYSAAPDVRRLQGGRVLLGGSPMRFLRLSASGAVAFDRLASGDPVRTTSPAEAALADRLVGGGFLEPHPDADDGPFRPSDVTVVIPVRDRTQQLAVALAAIAAGDGPARPGRVLVVDDGSDDPAAIAAVAAEYGAEVLRRDHTGGPAACRNSGLAEVTTPLVTFVDSDVAVPPGWLDPLVAHLGLDRVALAAPRVRTPAGGSVRSRYDAVRSPLDLGPRPGPVVAGSRVSYVPSAAVVCRVDALRTVDPAGFDPAMPVGEDVDLCWRLADAGWRCWFAGDEVEVVHDDSAERSGWSAWLRRRADYGTSAAPLDRRHPGSVAPLGVSGWSIAAWGLVALGHPIVATCLVAGTAGALVRKLDFLDDPRVAADLTVRGHLGAGELLAHAVVRPWFPFALGAAVVSRRARRVVVASAVVPALLEWRRRRPDVTPPRWVALAVADDVAYSVGVWRGCVGAGSYRALRPAVARWPRREDAAGPPLSAASAPPSS